MILSLGSLLTLSMLKTTRRLALLALSGLAVLVLAPQRGLARPIIVGSKDFTEQFILGEMYALALEAAGFTVERKLNLGGTPVAHAGLLSGEIDLYPEYTGTGLLTVLKLPTSGDPAEVYATVAREYESRFRLIWLDPAPMNNTQALAMTRTRAAELGIATISDMVAKAGELVMIGPPEFQAREDGLPGIQAAYGNFRLKAYKAVDPGLRYQGLVNGEADVAVAFGTDGEIAAFDLVLLEDDKQLFPPYQVAPVVRKDTLEANPGIAAALNALSPLLTDEVMQRLNYEVSGNRKEPAEVARAFLVEAGILKK
ncbi:quaternary ammonium transporter [Synechococcus sp. R55.6]|uniref:glycine betaine ABC transporter substrate-binding protein n=1 Tax=unclassified Synechococcus TaxID=2626047 RepID=UPI0039C2F119